MNDNEPLAQLLEEKAYSLTMQVQAQNAGHGLTVRDVDLFLERLQTARPKSAQAAGTNDDQFLSLFASIKKEKGASPPQGS